MTKRKTYESKKIIKVHKTADPVEVQKLRQRIKKHVGLREYCQMIDEGYTTMSNRLGSSRGTRLSNADLFVHNVNLDKMRVPKYVPEEATK